MSQVYNFTINFEGNAVQVSQQLTQLTANLTGKVAGLASGLETITQKMLKWTQYIQLTKEAIDGFNQLSQAGLELNSTLTDLSALTGVAGDKIKQIESYARATAKTFGGSAAQSVESYKLVLSQLGPEIANVPEALAAMGNNIATLSKTMGNNATGAAEVLTTAMNQYGVSLEDPIEASRVMTDMMNVMAAAAQAGSAELPAIQEALKQCGMAANSAGVTFEETNAAIQVLDKSGRKASEGGISLRNVLATLAQGRFLPQDVLNELGAAGISVSSLTDKTLSLKQRLDVLKPLLNDSALLSKMFGRENANAAMALIQGTDALEGFTTAVTGTTSAQDQAAVVMTSTQEKLSRVAAYLNDLQISLFNATQALQPFFGAISQTLVPLVQISPILNVLGRGLKNVGMFALKCAASIGGNTTVIGKAILGNKLYYGVLNKLSIAMKSAKLAATAMNAAILGIAGVAIMGVITLIEKLTQKHSEQKEAAEESARAEQEYKQQLIDSRAGINLMVAQLKDIIKNKRNEKDIVAKCNGEYGAVFGTYMTAAEWYEKLSKKAGDYIKIKANEIRINRLAANAADAQQYLDEKGLTEEKVKAMPERYEFDIMGSGIKFSGAINRDKTEAQKNVQIIKDANKETARLLAENESIMSGFGKTLPAGNVSGTVTPSLPDDTTRVQQAIKSYQSMPKALQDIADKNTALGTSNATLSEQTDAVKSMITSLIPVLGLESKQVQDLIAQYNKLNSAKLASRKESDLTVQPVKTVTPVETQAISLQAPLASTQSITDQAQEYKAACDMYADISAQLKIPGLGGSQIKALQDQKDMLEENYGITDDTIQQQTTQANVIGTLSGAMSTLGNAIGGVAGEWLNWAANLMQAISSAIPMIVALTGVEKTKDGQQKASAISGAASAVANVPWVGPILALAAIASITAAMLAIPKFAAGGIAYGPTLGLFGEYPGASNNPEVVAPLSKLRTMINTEGSGYAVVEFVIKGKTLRGFMKKIDRIDSRING